MYNILNTESNQVRIFIFIIVYILFIVFSPFIAQVVGIKKCWFVLEQENLRKDQMLAKIKQETGKAFILLSDKREQRIEKKDE